MKCPKCDGDMEAVTHGGVTIDQCTKCGGMWFDAGEAETLIETEGGADVDDGSTVKGWVMNFKKDISCPKCGEKMKSVSDTVESVVKFEACPNGDGYFMDAGEFRDIAHTNTPEKILEASLTKARDFATVFKSLHFADDGDKS